MQRKRDDFSFSRREITRKWMEVLGYVQKEHERRSPETKKTITELLDIAASLKKRNDELDEKRKKALFPIIIRQLRHWRTHRESS